MNTVKVNGVQRPAVDSAAYELAEHFLGTEPGPIDADDAWNLAGTIQQAVEDWFESREHAASLTAMGAEDGREGSTGETGRE